MTVHQETRTATISANMPGNGETWEQIGARKRAALQASIPKEWVIPAELLPPDSQNDVTTWPESSGWFTQEELAITDLSATELVSKLASGTFSSVDVIKAFCKRAAAAHTLV